MEAGVVLLDSECRERVDLTRSLHRSAMTAICAFRPKTGVEVKWRSGALATIIHETVGA
jgi:hypothetical protein